MQDKAAIYAWAKDYRSAMLKDFANVVGANRQESSRLTQFQKMQAVEVFEHMKFKFISGLIPLPPGLSKKPGFMHMRQSPQPLVENMCEDERANIWSLNLASKILQHFTQQTSSSAENGSNLLEQSISAVNLHLPADHHIQVNQVSAYLEEMKCYTPSFSDFNQRYTLGNMRLAFQNGVKISNDFVLKAPTVSRFEGCMGKSSLDGASIDPLLNHSSNSHYHNNGNDDDGDGDRDPVSNFRG